jgi:hypothetical protein
MRTTKELTSVKCSRCKVEVHPAIAKMYEWKVVTYVTPIFRRVKTKTYCQFCEDKIA